MGFANFVPYRMKISEVQVINYEHRNLSGVLQSPFYMEDKGFQSTMELILLLEHLQDCLGYPESTVDIRTFTPTNSIQQPGETEVSAVKRGASLATFRIAVFFRQNATWQGTLLWVEKDEIACFRSVLELVKLLDSALAHSDENSHEANVSIRKGDGLF